MPCGLTLTILAVSAADTVWPPFSIFQVDKVDTSATVASVDDHLNIVRPAIKSMGGAVEVVSVEGDVVTLKYKGPAPLAKGLVAAGGTRQQRT